MGYQLTMWITDYGIEIIDTKWYKLLMRKLLSLFARKEARPRKPRYFSGVSMRGQLQRMKRMNQGVISMSGGR